MTNAPITDAITAFGASRARVLRLLGERRRRVEAVDHVERHEHRDEERPGREARAARVEDDAGALVVMEERDDEREDDHAEDLEEDAGVVDDRDEANAEDVHHRDQRRA